MNRTPPMPPITQRWDRLIDASKFVILQKVQMVDAIGATANYAWQKQTTKARTILRRTVQSESQWRYDELHTVLICPRQMKAVLYSSRYPHWMCLDRIFFIFATAWALMKDGDLYKSEDQPNSLYFVTTYKRPSWNGSYMYICTCHSQMKAVCSTN